MPIVASILPRILPIVAAFLSHVVAVVNVVRVGTHRSRHEEWTSADQGQ